MKTRLILGFLLVLFSVQTMGMGHPHNLFAAHKSAKAKAVLMAPLGRNTNKKQEPAASVKAQAERHTLAGRISSLLRRSFIIRCLFALLFTGQPVGAYWAVGQQFR